jgi:hypothetical protein
MPVAKILLRNFLTNLVLAPIVGTALAGLFYGQPLLVVWIDIAGVPAVVYALVSTSIPVVILTALGNLTFWWLSRHRFSMWKWQVMAASRRDCGFAGGPCQAACDPQLDSLAP